MPGGGAPLSHDGKWLAYRVQRSNGNHELRVSALAGGKNQVAAFGDSPAFSADSQWLAYSIGMHEDEEEKLKKDKKPVRRKLGLMRLATGEVVIFNQIESFAFSNSGAYLVMKHYGPDRPAPTPNEPPQDPIGTAMTVRDLASGADTTFAGVASFAWQDLGTLLAFTVSNEGKAGNGVQVFDASTGSARVIESSAAFYTGLAWRKDSSDLAVLRVKADDKREDDTSVVLTFRDAKEKTVFDPTGDANFPTGKRIVKHRVPMWSEDGAVLFLGLADWKSKPEPLGKKPEVEPAGVEVWHSQDRRIMPEQKLRASRDRQCSALAAYHLKTSKVVPLTDDAEEEIRPLRNPAYAIAYYAKNYEKDAMFGRPRWDIDVIDTASGQRKRLLEGIEWAMGRGMGPSPSGRYFSYLKANELWVCEIQTGKQTPLTRGLTASFINRDWDYPVKQKPPYGIAGWTKDDRSLLAYDQFDVWQLSPEGSKPERITNGAADQMVHRYVRLDPKEEFFDPEKPIYFELHGYYSKRSGVARYSQGKTERLLVEDKRIGRLSKARNADVFVWTMEAFDDSPDFFTASAGFANPKQLSETNAFQTQYVWGRAELVEYRNPAGVRLQGVLYYPADYQPGRQYPMIVNIYERMSDNLHRYSSLSNREMYSTATFSNLGYFVLMPDIVFRPRDPGRSIVECVTAAVTKVLAGKREIDPKRVGLIGHSWGAYGTTFTITQSSLFAAAVAGAPLTNLSSSYGEVYWNSGMPETGHVETGQERMEVPLYADREAFIRNSATFHADRMSAPLLIAHGDKDGACDLHQSVEMYNVARRAGKQLVLLVYAGENHGLVSKPVRVDYVRRIHEWFGHYLKGEPAPEWITKGVPFLERERELKRIKDAEKKPAPASAPVSTSP